MLYFFIKKYEDWKNGLPDMKWLDEIMPDQEKWPEFSKNLNLIKNSLKDSLVIGKQ